LQEGEENEKLYHHPSSATSYWAYMVLHNPVYYIAEFSISVLLMVLALLEKPTFLDVPVRVCFLLPAYGAQINTFVYANALLCM